MEKQKNEGGIVEIKVTSADIETLYVEGNIQFLDENKRLVKIEIVEEKKPEVIMWCNDCDRPADYCPDLLTHDWKPKWF